ncbi:alpha/beta hydrolase [Stigmatella sp. ncwal1]|uniref:Alpha/beta hydrolase n=1 Tax=Stigmatella ashevillensis TaxID=2995309 RepID=A0ABT5D0Y5_9BACT|nr:alpha/beta hydrolase [Stigmatella ashevillena]MDC0707324.1 alpha/beta hydrolase [Stigmatella ashevillena]
MVQKGQFLERSTLIPVGREVMEGTAHRGVKKPPLLIIPPRPEEGGGMDHVVAAELVWAAATAGFPTLRFNHRGVGGSQGSAGTGEALVVDAEAAMRVLLENAQTAHLAVASLHGGARVALELLSRQPAVGGVCLVAPVDVEPAALARVDRSLLVVLGEEDKRLPRAALTSAVGKSPRGEIEVVDAAGPSFQRNLPQVGRLLAEWLKRLSGE